MRYRPPDNHDLPKAVFERKVKNNAYIQKIYDYPEIIIPHPTPEQIQKLLSQNDIPNTPLHVEIGCGAGQYIVELSSRFPTHFFVGFELRYKRLFLAGKKLKRRECSNVILLKDKGEYLAEYLGNRSIDTIHVNFPDPWAKEAQRKHRLLSESFFQTLECLLKPNGEFIFKTDHQEYFLSVEALLQNFPKFARIEYTRDLHNSPYNERNIETEFEKMFRHKVKTPIGHMKVKLVDGA